MPEIPMADQLKYKLKLERTFAREIRVLFAVEAKQFRQNLKEDPLTFLMALNTLSKWEILLDKHYQRAQKLFKHVNFDELPDNWDEEEYLLLLALWRKITVSKRARLLAATDEKVKNTAIKKTRGLFVGRPQPSKEEFSLIATSNMRRLNKGRVGNIATTETQTAVESGKFIEAETFQKRQPQPDPEKIKKVIKRWQTRRDNKVRNWHVKAEGQTRDIDIPFIVMSEKLKYPGDTSLGASMQNVANCRCLASYLGTAKQLERARSQGLLIPTAAGQYRRGRKPKRRGRRPKR